MQPLAPSAHSAMIRLSDPLPRSIMQLTRHVDANAPLCTLIRRLATRPGFVPTHLPQVQVLSWDPVSYTHLTLPTN